MLNLQCQGEGWNICGFAPCKILKLNIHFFLYILVRLCEHMLENSRKTTTSASLTMLKPSCGSQQTKFLQRWEYQTTLHSCVSQQTEKFLKDGNSRLPHWLPEKPVCRSGQFSLVTQLCPTLSDPMDCSMPGLPVHHQLLEFIQTHVHWIGDAIQPSHPLSSPSPPTFNLSQHQGLFKWVSS